MQVVSNPFLQAYQAPIRSLTANFCGKMIYLIDQVHLKIAGAAQLKISDSIRRIVLIASALFSLVALGYWIMKNSSEISKIFDNQPQTPATLASEIDCAKQEILQRLELDDSDFAGAESAKLFLAIRHGGKDFLKTVVLPQDVNKEQILKHLDNLDDIQAEITFDHTSETVVRIGILAKDKSLHQGQFVFSNIINGRITTHRGETSDPNVGFKTNQLASIGRQYIFCDLMKIPRAPQFDAQGNFI